MRPGFQAATRMANSDGALILPLGSGEIIIPVKQIKQIVLNNEGIKDYKIGENNVTLQILHGDGQSYHSCGTDLGLFKEAYKLALQGQVVELKDFIRQAGSRSKGAKPSV